MPRPAKFPPGSRCTVQFRMDVEMRNQLFDAAAAQDKTISEYMEALVKRDLKRTK